MLCIRTFLIATISAVALATSGATADLDALRDAVAQTSAEDRAAIAAMPDNAREEIRALYARANTALDEASALAAKADALAKEAADADRRIAAARAALDALPNADETPEFPALKPGSGTDAVAALLAKESAEFEAHEAEVRDLRKRFGDVLNALGQADAPAASRPPSAPAAEPPPQSAPEPLARARDLVRDAEAARDLAAAALVRQEIATAEPRSQALRAELDLAEAKLLLARRRIAALEKRRDAEAQAEADAKRSLAEDALKAAAAMDPRLAAVASDTAAFSDDLVRVTARIAEMAATRRQGEEEAANLRREQDALRADTSRGAMPADVLMDALQRLPDAAKLRGISRWIGDALAEDRVRAFRVADRLRNTKPPQEEAKELSAGAEAERVLAQRRAALRDLDAAYGRLVREYGAAITVAEDLIRLTMECRSLIERAMFWARAAPPIFRLDGNEFLRGAEWVLGPKAWARIGEGLRTTAGNPAVPGALALVALTALLLRRKAVARIAAAAGRVRSAATDHMVETWAAAGATAILAVRIPITFAAVVAAAGAGTSAWAAGLVAGAKTIFPALGLICFLRETCRADGLGTAHFRWGERPVRKLRSFTSALLFFAAPAGLLVRITLENPESFRYQNDFGRVLFIGTTLVWSVALARLLNVKDGMFSTLLQREREKWWARCAPLWATAAAGFPLAVGCVAAAGYLFAALALHGRFLTTAILAVSAALAHALISRWFACRARQLARAEAAECAIGHTENGTARAEVPCVKEPEETIETVQSQVQMLLKFGLLLVLALGTWGIWKVFLPFLGTGGGSWAGAIEALAILAALAIVVKNLPGVLEVAFLRHLDLQPGTRYAVVSLGRYALVAAGIALAWNAVGWDGSRLGWIFAALSVGLGFGLQEVVANFVCGIILLFERPVRVGDIVTVGDVTGVVSRIQIRATTITDWDRKEFIVPNKEFITGRLLNWTLSNTVSRITVPVSVAYGSDPERVRSALLDVAKAHPKVLRDPAPLVAFDKFGESSLDFLLRFFVANVDDRVGTQTDVMSAIVQRLAAEGIEIPFPHRRVIVENAGPCSPG